MAQEPEVALVLHEALESKFDLSYVGVSKEGIDEETRKQLEALGYVH